MRRIVPATRPDQARKLNGRTFAVALIGGLPRNRCSSFRRALIHRRPNSRRTNRRGLADKSPLPSSACCSLPSPACRRAFSGETAGRPGTSSRSWSGFLSMRYLPTTKPSRPPPRPPSLRAPVRPSEGSPRTRRSPSAARAKTRPRRGVLPRGAGRSSIRGLRGPSPARRDLRKQPEPLPRRAPRLLRLPPCSPPTGGPSPSPPSGSSPPAP